MVNRGGGGHGMRWFCSKKQKKEGKEEEGESKGAKSLFAGLNRRRRRRIRARHRRQRWRQSREKTKRKKKGNFPKALCTISEDTGTSR
jgi:hypothetical protein